jgi:hypothetical protein
MTKKTIYKIIESRNYGKFVKVADNFIKGAELAFEFEYYNAAGVLVIHAAIALAEAVTIKKSSKKSAGENHLDVVPLLIDVTPPDKNKQNALENLKKLIEHKNTVSYSGDIYGKKDVEKLLKYFRRYEIWANTIIKA